MIMFRKVDFKATTKFSTPSPKLVTQDSHQQQRKHRGKLCRVQWPSSEPLLLEGTYLELAHTASCNPSLLSQEGSVRRGVSNIVRRVSNGVRPAH